MAVQYATIDDYFAFHGETRLRALDADEIAAYDAETLRLNALLKRASSRVKTAARLGRVHYQATGIPSSTAIARAFAEATCAQADWFEETGDLSGAGDRFDSVSLLDVSFARRASSGATGNAAGASRVAPEANEILQNAGIFTTAVNH